MKFTTGNEIADLVVVMTLPGVLAGLLWIGTNLYCDRKRRRQVRALTVDGDDTLIRVGNSADSAGAPRDSSEGLPARRFGNRGAP